MYLKCFPNLLIALYITNMNNQKLINYLYLDLLEVGNGHAGENRNYGKKES